MADVHLQVTVHLAVAAAAINNLPHKGQHIAIKAYKKYTLPDSNCQNLSGRVFLLILQKYLLGRRVADLFSCIDAVEGRRDNSA